MLQKSRQDLSKQDGSSTNLGQVSKELNRTRPISMDLLHELKHILERNTQNQTAFGGLLETLKAAGYNESLDRKEAGVYMGNNMQLEDSQLER